MARKTTKMHKDKIKEKAIDQSYTTTLLVDQTPEAVFDAVNNVRGWWSGEIDGSTGKLGVQFKYSYKDLHSSSQKITELVPGKKVV